MEILGTDYLVATLDFETFYGTKYSLTSMNTFTYVDDPRFSIHGVGLKLDDGPAVWYRDTQEALDAIEAKSEELGKPVALLCHNTYFDGWIMHAKFNWHPDLYLDTMGMSRGMFPTCSASLEKLCERLWPDDKHMRKGKELIKFKDVTTEQLYANPAMLRPMIDYCCGTAKRPGDVELTYAAFVRMLPFYPDKELELIHLTLQMHCEPMLYIDVPRVVQCRDNAVAKRDEIIKASGLSETLLSSNAQFERWLIANDIPVPMKDSPTKFVKDAEGNDTDVPEKIPALGKSDEGFLELRELYPQFEHVWAGRIAAKSVGEITRAERFLQTAEQTGGFMPVPLIYYSARTGRYGGGEKLNLQNLGRGSELRKSLCAPDGQLVYVADSSNIEARMLAWEAGHESLLDQFRNKEDVYSNFASTIYNKPINKHEHPVERFIGKTCVLGLGYQVGWRKLRSSLATSAEAVTLDELEAQRIVNLYRTINAPIKSYWAQAENAIADMYMGNMRQWGPLTIHKNCLVMPNGMALQYPGLRPVAPAEDGSSSGGWEYWEGTFWTNLYGGKLCLAKGTQVLTRLGWTNIEEILPNTEVWDGVEWVSCDGNVYNGDKPVLELAGVAMTPDHEVLTNEGWKTASQSQGHNRLESRLPNGDGLCWKRWEEIPVVGPVRLRGDRGTAGHRADQDEKTRSGRLLRMQKVGEYRPQPNHARDVEASSLRRVALNDRPLHPTDAPIMGQLRRAWHSGMQAVAGVLRSLLGRHGGHLPVWTNAGPCGQRPTLQSRKLPLGNLQHAGQQPQDFGANQRQDGEAAFTGIRDRGDNTVVSDRAWLAIGQATAPTRRNQPVYDLINCGPRNRFVVRDGNGKPLIVHNCENITQALARIVLFDQMLAINALFEPHGGRVVMNVHDEIIAVGPNLGKDDENPLFRQMLEIMRAPPSWCADLPLDGEGGTAAEYSK